MVRTAFAFRLVTEVRFDFIEVPLAPAGLETPGVALIASGYGAWARRNAAFATRHPTCPEPDVPRIEWQTPGAQACGAQPLRCDADLGRILLDDGRRLHGSFGRGCAVRQGAARGPRSIEEAASAHRRCGLQAFSSLFMAPATSGPSSVRPYVIIPRQTSSAGAGRSIVPNQGSASKNPAATRNDAPK
jgi:hypothetical protein